MSHTESALRLTIFVGADDRWQHRPLHDEIVRRAHEAGLAGATVLCGCEGYGHSDLIHTTRLLSLAEDLPVMVIIVDTEERVRGFLARLDGLITDGMVLLDEVEVVPYPRRHKA